MKSDNELSKNDSLEPKQWAIETISLPHEIAFVFLVCMSQLMTQAALGMCLSSLDIIGNSFNITNPGILSWFIAGYSLTSGTFILIFGRLGDIYGYRNMYILGFLWFSLWSLVAGVSVYSNQILFIFARALQGFGPAMLLPNSLALLGSAYPPGERKNMVFSFFGATAPNGAILGCLFSSLFSQLAWWPWAFWTMAITCFVVAILGYFLIPDIKNEREGKKSLTDLYWDLDIAGASLGIIGLVLVNISWNQAPVVGWNQPYVYVLLIIGAIFLAAFFVVELKYAKHPLIPFNAFSIDVSFVLGCIACGWASFGVWIYYLWRFSESIRGNTPLLSTAQLVPAGFSGFAASFTTGILMSKIRPGWIMLLSMCAFTLGNVLMSIAPVHQTYWALTFVAILVTPWGMDMSFPAATVILSDSVQRQHQGIAASLVTTVVNYSISLGLGFAGTVEVHVDDGGLTVHDVLKGYRGALYMGIGLGGLGVLISLSYLLKSYYFTKKKENELSEKPV